MNNWIEHLQHPLVLAGFGLFVFAASVRPIFLNNKKLSGAATERLLRRGINFVFVLALLAIIGGLALSWRNSGAGKDAAHLSSGGKTAGATVEQATGGAKSPAVNSGKDVRINYGGTPPAPQEAADKTDAGATEQQVAPMQVNQTTQGKKSPAINAQGDVEINYAE